MGGLDKLVCPCKKRQCEMRKEFSGGFNDLSHAHFFPKTCTNWNRMMSYIKDMTFSAYFKSFLKKGCLGVGSERHPDRDIFCRNFLDIP